MIRDHTGERVGTFEIVDSISYKDKDGHALYKGVCVECGYERIARYNDLKRSKKCDHKRVDGKFIPTKRITWKSKKLQMIFSGMKSRCYDVNDKAYRWYGKKGIRICDEWMDDPSTFQEWAFNNGYSEGLSIDRINSNFDYCPENCRWVTFENNAKYKSTTFYICVDGEMHSGKDWSKILNLGINTIVRYTNEYGIDKTVEFIKKCKQNPSLKNERKNKQSYYDLYMN